MKKAKRMQLVNALAEAAAQLDAVEINIKEIIERLEKEPTLNIYKSGLVTCYKEEIYLDIEIKKLTKKLKI